MPFLASPSEIIPALSMPGGPEWIVILLVALLLFGKRLPEIMRGLGSSVREFKKGMDEDGPHPAVQQEPVRPVDGAISRAATQPLPPPAPPASAPAPAPQTPNDNQRLGNL